MGWKRSIPWFLWVCELIVFVCLFGMLTLAGISAGFTWWPMPTALAVGLCFTFGCVFLARKLGPWQRWILWTVSIVPAAYFGIFIAKDSWRMAHPIVETWVIPFGYHGPIYVVRGIQRGVIASLEQNKMIFYLDDQGIAAVREAPDIGWVHSTYEYRSADGKTTVLPEAEGGSIDDTPANRQDTTRRIYFPGSGQFADGSGCAYSVNEAYLESPSEALSERSSLNQVGREQDDLLKELERRYPGQCTSRK
jgi:hypothetical protein